MSINISSFFLILLLGTAPSLVWLFYYLRKDVHPEPKELILQFFLIGFLLPPFVGFAEVLLQQGLSVSLTPLLAYTLLILLASLWEEAAKYLAARSIFHYEREFDEMTDGMIYLIAVGLGFASSENIIIALSSLVEDPSQDILVLLSLRAIGSTLLHTLASGLIGYFLARKLFLQERFSLLKGFAAAIAIHALFNLFILQISWNRPYFIFLVILLLAGGLTLILKDFYNLRQYDVRQ